MRDPHAHTCMHSFFLQEITLCIIIFRNLIWGTFLLGWLVLVLVFVSLGFVVVFFFPADPLQWQ